MLTQMNGAYVRSNIELLETYASLSLRKSFKMRIMIFWPKLNLSIEQEIFQNYYMIRNMWLPRYPHPLLCMEQWPSG